MQASGEICVIVCVCAHLTNKHAPGYVLRSSASAAQRATMHGIDGTCVQCGLFGLVLTWDGAQGLRLCAGADSSARFTWRSWDHNDFRRRVPSRKGGDPCESIEVCVARVRAGRGARDREVVGHRTGTDTSVFTVVVVLSPTALERSPLHERSRRSNRSGALMDRPRTRWTQLGR